MVEGRIRLLHLIPKYSRGNDLINNYIGRLDPERFHSVLCYMDRGPMQRVSPERYEIQSLGFDHKELRRFQVRVAARLRRLLEEKRPDLLHCHRHRSVLYGVLASRWYGRDKVRIVASVHSMRRSRNMTRKLTNRLLFPAVSKILAVSEGVRADILRANSWLPPEKVQVVHNGIDPGRFPLRDGSGSDEGRPVVGTAARLVKTKGQTYLLRAFSRLLHHYPDARLLIAGEGPLRDTLQQEAGSLGISSRVEFLGFQKNVSAFLRRLDIFVLPSLAEGLCLAVLEAMATGIPVIASRVGGIPEIFDDVPFGRLVPARDPQALCAAILEFASMEGSVLRTLGLQARRRVEQAFSLDRMAGDFQEIYLREMEAADGP